MTGCAEWDFVKKAMKIIVGILILAVIIFIHEMGHFLIARLNSINVVEFAVGFGPKLFGWKTKSGTKVSIRLVMLGAACVFDNLDAPNEDDEDNSIASVIENSTFRKANVWSRISTVIAGPLFNLLLAFVLGLFLLSFKDIPSNIVTKVNRNAVAYEAGIREGDKIISVNRYRCYLACDAVSEIELSNGGPLTIIYEHNGKRINKIITPDKNAQTGSPEIGIVFEADKQINDSLASIAKSSFLYVRYTVRMTYSSLKMLLSGQADISDMAGPVGAIEIIGNSYENAKAKGITAILTSMLNIAIILSSNIGIINLFPIPAFDGGKLVFLIYEAIKGKPADSRIEGTIQLAGMGLLLMLFAVIMYNDFSRLFPGT